MQRLVPPEVRRQLCSQDLAGDSGVFAAAAEQNLSYGRLNRDETEQSKKPEADIEKREVQRMDEDRWIEQVELENPAEVVVAAKDHERIDYPCCLSCPLQLSITSCLERMMKVRGRKIAGMRG